MVLLHIISLYWQGFTNLIFIYRFAFLTKRTSPRHQLARIYVTEYIYLHGEGNVFYLCIGIFLFAIKKETPKICNHLI